MRRAIAIASFAIAGSAAAQPSPPPRCDVTIAHAPDEVRAEIEGWLAQESRCSVALEVRVVPSEGGYYLFARDALGRIRERVVPDAASAGVLVASWAASDGFSPPPPAVESLPQPPPTTFTPEPPSAPIYLERASAARGTSPRWVTATGFQSSLSGLGGRVDIDVLRWGGYAFGVALDAAHSHRLEAQLPIDGEMTATSFDVLAMASATVAYHGWRLRGGFGVGARMVQASVDDFGLDAAPSDLSSSAVTAVANATLFVGHDVGAHWGLDVGLMGAIYDAQLHMIMAGADHVLDLAGPELSLAVALRHSM